ncbi:MAG: cation:proton antiporter [Thermoanaerobaculia bacterium]
MNGIPILADLIILFAAAVLIIVVSQRLRLHPVLGLLLAGIAIGPSGLALISEPGDVRTLAGIGVVALLFTIGLEFSGARLRRIWRPFLIGGSSQALGTIAIVLAVSVAVGFEAERSLFFGFLIALSSTAIVLGIYGDRNEIDAPHGRFVLGILLFQDFLVVPMIMLIPLLGGSEHPGITPLLLRFGFGLLVLAVVFGAGRYLLPPLLHILVRTRVREVLVLGVLVAALGMALLTESLHFSLALGAFLAGILISESEYSHQVIAEVAPFRDVFASVFFVSIGMLLNLRFFAGHAGTVVLLAVGIIGLKLLLVSGIVRLMRYPIRTAVSAGAALAQIGEFSFVLATVGLQTKLIDGDLYQLFLATAILTMMVTPLSIASAPSLVSLLERLGGSQRPREKEMEEEETARHVIIIGFGVTGSNLAHVLREVKIPYRVVELDGDIVRACRKSGEPIFFGDATRREILELAGIERAAVVVVGISDAMATERIVRFARDLNPSIHIVVRTPRLADIERIDRLGADDVLAEEFETSIEIFTRVLERFHIPRNIIQAQRQVLRADAYEIFRRSEPQSGISRTVAEILGSGLTDIFRVEHESHAAERTLEELNLRRATGASIIAVVRDQQAWPGPPANLSLKPNDFVVVVGGHAEIDAAFRFLASGPELDDDRSSG